MTRYEIPALLLTLAALWCAVRWTMLGRRGDVRQDTLYPAIGIAVLVAVLGTLTVSGTCAGSDAAVLQAITPCLLLVPGLLIAGALATIGAPPTSKQALRTSWLVMIGACVFAVGSCAAML